MYRFDDGQNPDSWCALPRYSRVGFIPICLLLFSSVGTPLRIIIHVVQLARGLSTPKRIQICNKNYNTKESNPKWFTSVKPTKPIQQFSY